MAGFWRRLFGVEQKGITVDQLALMLRGSNSAAGASVTNETAMRVAAVNSCVRVISESVASLPLHVFRRLPSGKERLVGSSLAILLNERPNAWQTAMEFRELMQAHLCLRGNAYAAITRGRDGSPIELLPLHPDEVRVEILDNLLPRYIVTRSRKAQIPIPWEDMFHVRGLSSDGYVGRSPLLDARESIGVSIATQEYAGRFWSNDATPGVVLKHPGKLSADAATRLRDSWDDKFGGSSNARRTALLEEGMSIDRMTLTAEDSQFLDTRKFQRSEIAGIFRVPPHMIGDLDRATFSNIESQSISFVTNCLRPWLVRWEQAISRDLIRYQRDIFAEHMVDGLLRGDIQTRYAAYAVARQWGWLSVNDIRAKENLNPVADGDVYLQPMNMEPAGTQHVDPPPGPTVADVAKAREEGSTDANAAAMRELARKLGDIRPPTVLVDVAAPVVNIEHKTDVAAPTVNLEAAMPAAAPPTVVVQPAAPESKRNTRTIVEKRDAEGRIVATRTEEA